MKLLLLLALTFSVQAQEEPLNECGETKIQEASSDSFCMSPSEEECDGGPASSRGSGPIKCLMLDTYEFMEKYELVDE